MQHTYDHGRGPSAQCKPSGGPAPASACAGAPSFRCLLCITFVVYVCWIFIEIYIEIEHPNFSGTGPSGRPLAITIIFLTNNC
eukprot:10994815-Heterocapsa_arctica.AAC.1